MAIYRKDEKACSIARKKVEVLRLGKGYIWRIVQALDWGFANFDSANVQVDLGCLSDADRQRLIRNLYVAE
jgi:hypothetical protein